MNMNWPEPYRMALSLSFDIDAETLWLTRNPINYHHPVHVSRGRYSVKQGIPRILRMLEQEGVHATFFTPAWTAEHHPDVIKCIADCGHEISYHGYLHEVCDTCEEEDALMKKAEDIIRGITGRRPMGQRSPDGILHDFHLGLWQKRGYIYSSNWRNTDRPFIHTIHGKPVPIVELPKDSINDDTSYDMYTIQHPEHYYLKTGREMVGIWEEELDGLLEEKGYMNFVMHPQFIGHPGYVRALRQFIRYALDHQVWVTTDAAIARYLLVQNGFPEYAEPGEGEW
jgi:peptidoglycan/xylan/chitin deacetylase (PgdA/CDA1 family)